MGVQQHLGQVLLLHCSLYYHPFFLNSTYVNLISYSFSCSKLHSYGPRRTSAQWRQNHPSSSTGKMANAKIKVAYKRRKTFLVRIEENMLKRIWMEIAFAKTFSSTDHQFMWVGYYFYYKHYLSSSISLSFLYQCCAVEKCIRKLEYYESHFTKVTMYIKLSTGNHEEGGPISKCTAYFSYLMIRSLVHTYELLILYSNVSHCSQCKSTLERRNWTYSFTAI